MYIQNYINTYTYNTSKSTGYNLAKQEKKLTEISKYKSTYCSSDITEYCLCVSILIDDQAEFAEKQHCLVEIKKIVHAGRNQGISFLTLNNTHNLLVKTKPSGGKIEMLVFFNFFIYFFYFCFVLYCFFLLIF